MTYTTPVSETLSKHVTVRSFKDEPVPEQMITTVIEAARRSPTSSNMQTYSIVVVRDRATRKVLARLAGNQKHIETCDTFLAFCADLNRLRTAVAMHGVEMANSLELSLIATVDAALVGMSAQTVAESFGLGGVMIGAMRNSPKEVAHVLGLPHGVYVVYGMCLGWPESIPVQKPRLPAELVVHYEQYSQSDPTPAIAAYDDALAEHYGLLSSNQHEAAWSGPIAARLDTPPRPHLHNELESMGFSFE